MARYMVMGRHLQREKRDIEGPVINYGRWEKLSLPLPKKRGVGQVLAILKVGRGLQKVFEVVLMQDP